MQFRCLWAMTVCVSSFVSGSVSAQVIRPVRRFSTEGIIKSVQSGRLAITDRTGKSWPIHIGSRKDGRVSLDGSRVFVAPVPKIEISGELDLAVIERGFSIRFQGHISEKGRFTEVISELAWVDKAGFKPGVKTDRKVTDQRGNMACVVSGTVESINRGRLTVRVPRSRYASKGKMLVRVSEGAKVTVKTRDLSKVQAGDRVVKASGFELNTGDFVTQQLEIRLVEDLGLEPVTKKRLRNPQTTDSKYENYSDEKVAPRQVRSQHYFIQTDLSDRDVKILADNLEEMLSLISVYFGRPQPAPVTCYVVSDLQAWQKGLFPDTVKKKITNKEGITRMQSALSNLGRQSMATVYACDNMGVVRHEVVHAYCHLAFGSTGPTWYSEGLAEMGQYWKDAQREVDVDKRVIRYLKKAKFPRRLKEIVAPGEITGDSWEEYAWCWALCHLLTNNPNYNRKFKELGIGLMLQRPDVSFSKAYGAVAKQLRFEYDQFVRNVDNGYRADLCAWRWKHKFEPVEKKGHKTIKILAKAGWQPGVSVIEGVEYDYVAKGEWQMDATGTKSTANGDEQGTGKLVAVVMKDFTLGEPIFLGTKGKFKAPATGSLYLRCNEPWSRLGDNSGSLTAQIRLAK